MKISARNKLQGKVTKITKGSINALVEIELSGTPAITAMITNDAVDDLELTEGGHACAVIKASSVLIGVCQDGQGCNCPTSDQ